MMTSAGNVAADIAMMMYVSTCTVTDIAIACVVNVMVGVL